MKRKGLRIRGIVQGVGFRPFIAIGAKRYGLTGFVYNDSEGVYLEVEGEEIALSAFQEYLYEETPPMADMQEIEIKDCPLEGSTAFVITASAKGEARNTLIAPDTAPCEACLADMKDTSNRRYLYPFTNCTDCGPRYTIVQDIPYDRPNTTMSDFPMCEHCAEEYGDYLNRRYHAQPNACPTCGPHYFLQDGQGKHLDLSTFLLNHSHLEALFHEIPDYAQPLLMARHLIREGAIVAIKGIGGYHLACDAFNEEAVSRLRERKARPHKPFALMAGSLTVIKEVAKVNEEEALALQSPARPIVLLEKEEADLPSPSVAPANQSLGIMLGYTPMHAVLLEDSDLWVMTSGNRSGHPVLYKDEQAFEELQGIADYFLCHNRAIEAPVDDSVLAMVEGEPLFFRRSRGYVPAPFLVKGMPLEGKTCLLATGGDLKNAFALSKGKQIFLGPHIGDLANEATNSCYEKTIAHFERIFSVTPTAVVVDKHPAYFSRSYGLGLGLPLIEVQHHHAHIASVMAEYNLKDPVLGIALDGTGYGEDEQAWGGEFLLATPTDFQRLAHFSYAPLPGGEVAVREPWRQALWYLHSIYGKNIPSYFDEWRKGLPEHSSLLLEAMEKGLPTMKSCGAGRLFDAVGSLLGLGYTHSFDSQVAIALEQLAEGERGSIYEFGYEQGVLDFTPLIADLLTDLQKGVSRSLLAASFHRTLAYAVAEAGQDLQKQYQLRHIVLGGGVWQNRRLFRELKRFWPDELFYLPRRLPPSDGGIALGQLWVAAHRLQQG